MAAKNATQRDPVRRWTLIVLGLIVVLFLYSLIADRMTPYTSQATVQTFVVRMAPEVAGRVIEVNVIDNQRVKAGDVLFRIDPHPFTIALEQAEAQIGRCRPDHWRQHSRGHFGAGAPDRGRSQAGQRARASKPHPAACRKGCLRQSQKGSGHQGNRGRRSQLCARQLRRSSAPSRSSGRKAATIRNSARRSPRSSRPSSTSYARRSRPPPTASITNLQLTEGEFVAVGQAALTFIDTSDAWINANFRENSLENVKAGDPVELVLDTLPGRVFDAKVQSVGWGVSQGSIDPETGLPKINEPMGLVRNPQRFAVKIEPNRADYVPGSVRYGSQANVIVYATGNALVNAIGAFWIRLVAILTYVS